MNEGVASREDKASFHALRRVKTCTLKSTDCVCSSFSQRRLLRALRSIRPEVCWLLFKCSTVNKGFNGVETKSGINSTHFKTLSRLMKSYDIQIFLATKISSLSPSKYVVNRKNKKL